jgi:hypothetical protein
MVQTLIRGSTQIQAGTITVDRLIAGWDAAFINKNGTVPLTADWAVGGFKLTGLADGINPQDAVNIRVAQAMMAGIGTTAEIEVVATGNLALTGLQTVDSYTLVAGDPILLTAQSSNSQNGPWLAAAGAWTRPTWWAAASTKKAALFYVTRGTLKGDTKWSTITDGPIVVDTTPVSITQDFTGANYFAGNGILLTGSTFSTKLGNGVAFDGSNSITLTPDPAGLLSVGAAGIRIAAGTSGQVPVVNASGNLAYVAMSGDATIVASGAVTVNHTAGSGFLKYTDIVPNETPSGAVNGANTAFTLAATPQNSSLTLYYNGLLLEPGAGNDYTITGANITMLFVPLTDDKLRCQYFK